MTEWARRTQAIQVGDTVGYSKQFLQSTGQHTGVVPFTRGKVLALHPGRRSRFALYGRKSLKISRGRIDWCGVGFDYVEYRGKLHILDFWYDDREDRSTRKVDCVLGYPRNVEKYMTVTSYTGGVSLIS